MVSVVVYCIMSVVACLFVCSILLGKGPPLRCPLSLECILLGWLVHAHFLLTRMIQAMIVMRLDLLHVTKV